MQGYYVETHLGFTELNALLFYITYACLCSFYVDFMIWIDMFDVFSVCMCVGSIGAKHLNRSEKVLKS